MQKQIYYQPILTSDEWNSGELSSFMVYRYLSNAKADYPNHTIAAYEVGDIEDPTFVDDEDFRTSSFFVDIPAIDYNGNPKDEMINVAEFKTKDDAIKFAKDKFGADDNGMISLVSQS